MKGILGSGEPCALRIDWTSEGQCLPSQESHIMPEYQEHRKQENTVKIIDPVMNGCQTDTSRIAEQVRTPAARKTYPEPSGACPNGRLLLSPIKLSWHKVGWGSAPSVVGLRWQKLCYRQPVPSETTLGGWRVKWWVSVGRVWKGQHRSCPFT